MQDFWPDSGLDLLKRTERGWLRATDAWSGRFLSLPELALVDESCAAERELHAALQAAPLRSVSSEALVGLADADARDNYAMFLRFRDGLVQAGSLEAYYLQLMRGGPVDVAPVFVARVVEAIVHHLMQGSDDAFELRAAELLFRPQRVSLTEGRMLAADRGAIDRMNDTGGFGDIGRLLLEAGASLVAQEMRVLTTDNASGYWHDGARRSFVLDLTHELTNEVGHGLRLTVALAHSGLAALARVLQKWVAHLLGVAVAIRPLQRIDDPAWRWHIGLDVASMALLNDLYEGHEVDEARMRGLISLFRLDFENPAEMRADVAGKSVYLGLAMAADGTLSLKPQNLLLNLPLSATM